MLRWSVLVALATGCGRIAFDPHATTSGDGGASIPQPDGGTFTCEADGFCAPDCAGTDPDCGTQCGDSICAGNAGEWCTTCAADCRTTADVCGNGTCSPNESSATCYVDCGPSPWPWDQVEAEMLAAINRARTEGTECNGEVVTAPALSLDPALVDAARNLAWETAYIGSFGLTRCSGQGLFAYFAEVNAASAQMTADSTDTPEQWVAAWAAGGSCASLLNTNHTLVGVAFAEDMGKTYVAFLR